MVIDTPFLHCFFCGHRFGADFDAREGSFIRAWKIAVCTRCFYGNRTGPAADHPAIKKLTKQGVAIKATNEGIVPWPEEGMGVAQRQAIP